LAEQLYHTTYQSPFGKLKIAVTDTCVRMVEFMKEDEAIPPTNKSPLLTDCVQQLIEYFQGERRVFDLPLDQPGTGFQQQVWNLLCVIPYGKTISYLDLALRSGDRNNTRAVANANGRNRIAIIVPCHRVIGHNGSLTGYAGGLWRKKWLLELELKWTHGVQTLF
jgi:methylated-DNA-[protein]-cysteine S-methyltransferase